MCSPNFYPILDQTSAIVILIINIFIPGLGTILAACIGHEFNAGVLILGFFQWFTLITMWILFVFTFCFLPFIYIWGVLTGIFILQKSNAHNQVYLAQALPLQPNIVVNVHDKPSNQGYQGNTQSNFTQGNFNQAGNQGNFNQGNFNQGNQGNQGNFNQGNFNQS